MCRYVVVLCRGMLLFFVDMFLFFAGILMMPLCVSVVAAARMISLFSPSS